MRSDAFNLGSILAVQVAGVLLPGIGWIGGLASLGAAILVVFLMVAGQAIVSKTRCGELCGHPR